MNKHRTILNRTARFLDTSYYGREIHKMLSKLKQKVVNNNEPEESEKQDGIKQRVTKAIVGIDPVEKNKSWISSLVKGKTFADVGGIGVNSINERITLACKSGAQSATMIDIRPKEYYEWDVFHKCCKEAGVHDYQCIDNIDINDSDLLNKVGIYDFVHCTGIVYHLPNPVWGVANLSKIVDEYLIINTVIVPSKITTKEGTLEFHGSTALFMPGLNYMERNILNSYYMQKFDLNIDYMSPRLDAEKPDCPWFENGETTCWPYWWLFTENSFLALVKMMGFEILDTTIWENHAFGLLAKKETKGA